MDNVLKEIENEVKSALSKLPEGFEDQNTQNDYIAYVNAYIGRAAQGVFRNEREDLEYREMMIKAAAICVSAIVHYDNHK